MSSAARLEGLGRFNGPCRGLGNDAEDVGLREPGAGALGHLAPVAQHRHTVAHAQHLGDLGRNEDQRQAALAQRQHQLHDLLLGRHIDAARRFIQDEQVWFGRQPAGQDGLLLVAAGELADGGLGVGGLDAQRQDVLLGQRLLLAPGNEAQDAAFGLQRQHDVLAHRQLGDDGLGLALFRAIGHVGPHGIAWGCEVQRAALQHEAAGVIAVGAEEQAGGFGAARAQQAGQAQHFPRPHLQADGQHLPTPRQAFGLEQHRPCGQVWRRCERIRQVDGAELPPDHQADQAQPRQVGRQVLADELAIAHHRDAVGHRVGLVQKVGDEQNGHAVCLQAAQHREQSRRLGVVQAGGRLVEDEHAGVGADGASDRHHLLHSHGQLTQGAAHVHLDLERRQQGVCDGMRLPPRDPAPAAGHATRQDVLGHREVGAEVDLLVDRRNAEGHGLLWRCGRDGLPVQMHAAGVLRVDPRQDLDQRGLAGTVLAHQHMHLTGTQRQLRLLEREHARKALGDALQGQHRCGFRGRDRVWGEDGHRSGKTAAAARASGGPGGCGGKAGEPH